MNDIKTLLNNDSGYLQWRESYVVEDCLNDLGLTKISEILNLKHTTIEIITSFVHIIKTEARMQKREDVLERLYFAGLG